MSVTEQQVESLLENVLFESSTEAAANAASWEGKASTVADLAALMADSPEESIAAHVVGYYLSALGRAPSAAEIRYYVTIAEQGLTQSQIAAGQVAASTWDTIAAYLTHSPEFASRAGLDYSLGSTAALFEAVPWLYESVLGRTPSGVELSYYDNQIASGAGLNTLFREFTASPEFATDTSSQIAAALATYGADVASGQTVPTTIGSTVTLGAPAPPAPTPTPSPAPTWGVLTTGTDTIGDTAMSGAHTYQAIISTGAGATLNPADHLTGNGLATLAITDSDTGATAMMPGATLSGIETVTLTITDGDAGAGSSHLFDLSGVSGLTSFTLTSSGTLGDFLDTGSATSVSVTTQGTGDTVAITSDSLATLSLSGTLVGVALTDAGGPTSLTVDVDGVTLSSGLTDSSNHITSLTITGSGSASSIASIDDTALTSLTVSGDVALGSSGDPIVLSVDGFSVSGSNDTGAISLEFLLTGTTGGAGFNIGSGGEAGTGGSGGDGGGGTVTLGDGTDNFTDKGTGGVGGAGGSATIGGGSGGDSGSGGSGGYGGHNSLTLGAGDNTIVIDVTGGNGGNGGVLAITGGGGGNGGNGGSGGDGGHDTITLGGGDNTVTDNSQGGNGGNGAVASADDGAAAIGGNGGSGGDGGHNTIIVGNGNNTIIDNSAGGSGGAGGTGSSAIFDGSAGSGGASGNDIIAVGTGDNTVDLNGHGNDTVIVDTDGAYDAAALTANQTLNGASGGVTLEFRNDAAPGTGTVPAILTALTSVSLDTSSHGTASLQAYLQDAEASITTTGGAGNFVTSFTFGGDTYVLENNGSAIFDASHTVIVEVVGTPTVAINAGTGHITLT